MSNDERTNEYNLLSLNFGTQLKVQRIIKKGKNNDKER